MSVAFQYFTYEKGNHRMRKILVALLLLAVGGLAQAQVELKTNHPDKYTVVRGDTLWDISAKFLNKPWKWPEIWYANPQVANPHLIYPGDVLSLVYVDGQPRIMLDRGKSRGTVKLSPQVRKTPMAEAIPTIPLEAINSFLLSNRIIDSASEFDTAPYIVAGNAERVLSGHGDRVYARGNLELDETYNIFRQGKIYTDPETGEFLGINADYIGSGDIVAYEDDIGTMLLKRTSQEVRLADRLFHSEERAINSTFTISLPEQDFSGVILDVPRGVSKIGKYDVITINKGAADGLAAGTVLAIYKTGETVRDRVTGDLVKIPDERAGLAMVFRPYESLSYALVLSASRDLAIMDKVRSPD